MSTHLLVCLPFAGAGASFYRNAQAPAGIDILPIQLPGREERFADALYPDLTAAVADIAQQIHQAAAPGQRILLLGHSFGAILAFELARSLGSVVDHVYVSGSPDPWNPRAERAAGLTDDEFVARVETFAGYTHPTLAHPELRQIILPALRGDVGMHESYVAAPDAIIAAPITTLRGADDELVAEPDLHGWKRATSGEFSLRMFPGGHMYLADNLTETLEFIAAAARVSHG
ncbi:thioesterase II family protein [Nocardia inohanensis]|uniref:thioesterase II family protein n=1 Tax=Nocardia inohanensis TaxID=209246 RepID=UPI00082BCAEC|nr:alpha/beta fold hydrolase [Nocardia inohanensis]